MFRIIISTKLPLECTALPLKVVGHWMCSWDVSSPNQGALDVNSPNQGALDVSSPNQRVLNLQ